MTLAKEIQTMSFGKNPHVAKATLAEQKAKAAGDENTRESMVAPA